MSWDTMMERVLDAIHYNGCTHRNICWPRRDAEGAYVRCNECGKRIAYSGTLAECVEELDQFTGFAVTVGD